LFVLRGNHISACRAGDRSAAIEGHIDRIDSH
jgi:hypothetical protein